MKSITVVDNRNGEVLQIDYDSSSHKYSINSLPATRQAPLETSDDEYVFAVTQPEAQKLYHVLAKDLQRLLK